MEMPTIVFQAIALRVLRHRREQAVFERSGALEIPVPPMGANRVLEANLRVVQAGSQGNQVSGGR
jgi:hypothetical protein